MEPLIYIVTCVENKQSQANQRVEPTSRTARLTLDVGYVPVMPE